MRLKPGTTLERANAEMTPIMKDLGRQFPQADSQWDDADRDARWEVLLNARQTILLTLEGLRKNKTIGSAQEAVVTITGSPDGVGEVFF